MKNLILLSILLFIIPACDEGDAIEGLFYIATGGKTDFGGSGNNSSSTPNDSEYTLANGFDELAPNFRITGFLDKKNQILAKGFEIYQGIYASSADGFPIRISESDMTREGFYYYDDKLLLRKNNNLKTINLENKNILWEESLDVFNNQTIVGDGSQLFLGVLENSNNNSDKAAVIQKNLSSGFNTGIHRPEIQGTETKTGKLSEITGLALGEFNGNEYLLICYGDVAPNNHFEYFISLRNLSTGGWIFQRKPSIHLEGGRKPFITNGRIILHNYSGIYCYNLETGAPVWKREDWIKREVEAGEGYLLYADQSSKDLTCLNPFVGTMKWSRPAGEEGISNILILNNKVYSLSNQLQVHNLQSGILEKTVESPYFDCEYSCHFSDSFPLYGYSDNINAEDVLFIQRRERILTYKNSH